jgi:SAM-dependent methyltransferase
MELDEVVRWLDGLPLSGRIVELGTGSGWWAPLLAARGELWVYDADTETLDGARRRLLAHGLRAHLHENPSDHPSEPSADVVFAAYLLGEAPDDGEVQARLGSVRRWLKPGGSFVCVEAGPGAGSTPRRLAGPSGPLWSWPSDRLERAMRSAGLQSREIRSTRSSFVVGLATEPDAAPWRDAP